METLLTTQQVAEILQVSKKAVYQLLYRKRMPYLKFGEGKNGSVRISDKDLRVYIESHRVDPMN